MQNKIDFQYANLLLEHVFKVLISYDEGGNHCIGRISLVFSEKPQAYAALSYLHYCLKEDVSLLLTVTLKEKSNVLLTIKKTLKDEEFIQVQSSLSDTLEAIKFTEGNVPYGNIVLISFESQEAPDHKQKMVSYYNKDSKTPISFIGATLYRCDNDGFQIPF